MNHNLKNDCQTIFPKVAWNFVFPNRAEGIIDNRVLIVLYEISANVWIGDVHYAGYLLVSFRDSDWAHVLEAIKQRLIPLRDALSKGIV